MKKTLKSVRNVEMSGKMLIPGQKNVGKFLN